MNAPWFGRFARQVVRDILLHVTIATLAGLSLFIAVDFVETGNVTAGRGSAWDVTLLELAGLPVVYQQIAAFCALIGTLTALSALARRQEIVAMLAAGASPIAFLKPALVAGLVLATVYAMATEWIVPPARAQTSVLRRRLGLPTRHTDVLRKGRMWFKGRDRIYRVEDLEDEAGRQLGGVLMLKITDGRLEQRHDVERLRHTERGWIGERVLVRSFGENGIVTSSHAETKLDLVERPDDFVRSVGAPNRLPLARLYDSTVARERLGQPAVQHRLELYRRIGLPITIALAVALGAGLALLIGRRPSLALALGTGAGLGFLLWLVDEISLALAAAAALSPVSAAQLVPLGALVAGLYVWMRAMRRVR